eukprot:1190380-Prorocentrum_minimum.AAC.3
MLAFQCSPVQSVGRSEDDALGPGPRIPDAAKLSFKWSSHNQCGRELPSPSTCLPSRPRRSRTGCTRTRRSRGGCQAPPPPPSAPPWTIPCGPLERPRPRSRPFRCSSLLCQSQGRKEYILDTGVNHRGEESIFLIRKNYINRIVLVSSRRRPRQTDASQHGWVSMRGVDGLGLATTLPFAGGESDVKG